MFTIVNPQHWKRIQTNQREELTKIKKSDMEIQFLKPQIQDHSNKVLASKDFKRSTGLSISSNAHELRCHKNNHIIQAETTFQTFEENFPNQFLHAKRREAFVFSITH